jgi:hypothetical protein
MLVGVLFGRRFKYAAAPALMADLGDWILRTLNNNTKRTLRTVVAERGELPHWFETNPPCHPGLPWISVDIEHGAVHQVGQ